MVALSIFLQKAAIVVGAIKMMRISAATASDKEGQPSGATPQWSCSLH